MHQMKTPPLKLKIMKNKGSSDCWNSVVLCLVCILNHDHSTQHHHTKKSKPTYRTDEAINKILNCAATHCNAVARYKASDMVLHVNSDDYYLSKLKA